MADFMNWMTTSKAAARQHWRAFRKSKLRAFHLKRAAKARQALSGPVIAVTGSSTKSTTCGLLAHILAGQGRVKAQVFQNTPDYLPKTFLRGRCDQDFTVLELGVGGIGSMRPMAEVARPDMAIVTMIGLEHYTAFRSREAVAAEKGNLIDCLRANGKALLNADDALCMEMAERTEAQIITFGKGANAHYRLADVRCKLPEPMHMTVVGRFGTCEVQTRFNGTHFWLPTLAAFAAAVELGMTPQRAAERILTFEPAMNRCNLVRIPGGPDFLMDANKAPWDTLFLPFETVAEADAPRKTIVVGQISDYAGYANSKYKEAYRRAAACADRVIFVGDKRHRSGASEEDKRSGKFLEAADAKALYQLLKANTLPGELILLKSSGNLHLERAALAFQTEVRCWRNGCGVSGGCIPCGLMAVDPPAQAAAKRALRRDKLAKRVKDWFERMIGKNA